MTIKKGYSALFHSAIAWKTQLAMGVQHYLCRSGRPVLRDFEDSNAGKENDSWWPTSEKNVALSPKI